MAMVTIAFILYLLVPSGEKKDSGEEILSPPPPPPTQAKLPDETIETSVLAELNRELETELQKIYNDITASDNPFGAYGISGLALLPAKFPVELVGKLYKFSFSDLNAIHVLEFPDAYDNRLKLNLLLGLFLLKIQEENILEKFAQLPDNELKKKIHFEFYHLTDNEIEHDYQLIPVLFYFHLLTQRLNLYPREDIAGFFRERTARLRDLTPGKLLIQIREYLAFSRRTEKYRLQWIEHDGISPDDKQAYGDLNFATFHFMKQEYIIFPDLENNADNLWLLDLCEADNGEIELTGFSIRHDDPSRHLEIGKIVYSPLNGRFVVVLKAYDGGEGSFTDRLATRRMIDYHKNFTVIDFDGDIESERFKEALGEFGNFLKKNKPGFEE
jgi:hypothetical protein